MVLARPKFGVELEMFTQDQFTHPQTALQIFRDHDLTDHDSIHRYHCRCEQCAYDRPSGLLAAQTDATVGVEFITRILKASHTDVRELRRLVRAYDEVQRATRWVPDGVTPNGNHCHVGWPIRVTAIEKARATSYLRSLMTVGTDAWSVIGDGGCDSGEVRGYNAPPVSSSRWSSEDHNPYDFSLSGSQQYGVEAIGGGSWISERHFGTVEFRLWNTPADSDRLLVHPAISCALMQAGLRWAEIDRFDNAFKIYRWVEKNWDLAMRQVGQILREIWPDPNSAGVASELLQDATV